MRKKYNELTKEELRSVFADIETGDIDAKELTQDVLIEADVSTAFSTMVEVEKERQSGQAPKVVYVGKARTFLGMSEVVRQMVAGELEQEKHPYFTKSPITGVWQHDGNKTKITIPNPYYFEKDNKKNS